MCSGDTLPKSMCGFVFQPTLKSLEQHMLSGFNLLYVLHDLIKKFDILFSP